MVRRRKTKNSKTSLADAEVPETGIRPFEPANPARNRQIRPNRRLMHEAGRRIEADEGALPAAAKRAIALTRPSAPASASYSGIEFSRRAVMLPPSALLAIARRPQLLPLPDKAPAELSTFSPGEGRATGYRSSSSERKANATCNAVPIGRALSSTLNFG
jgi:hypothetical protein